MLVNSAQRYTGSYERKINRFIKEFVTKIAICTHDYSKVWRNEWEYSDYNLLYKERQIYSLMSAAMHQITPVHQSESSVTRRRDKRSAINRGLKREGKGRVDLWAYKDGIEYFFEFKRSYLSLNTLYRGSIPDQVHVPWRSLVGQVKAVRSGLDNQEYTCCIGLQVITPYKSSDSKCKLLDHGGITRGETEQMIVDWMRGFNPIPDSVLWYSNDEEMRIVPTKWDEEDKEERWEFHPFHLFFFTIFPRMGTS